MLGLLIVWSVVHLSCGPGYNNVHGTRGRAIHGSGGKGLYHNYQYDYMPKTVPKLIPYLDRNGCRFPGDVVCNPTATDGTTYGYCVLSNENKNLWKKPSMEIVVAMCVPEGTSVLSDWCNDNQRLLRAVGFIRDKEKLPTYYHSSLYTVCLNPCILIAPTDGGGDGGVVIT